MPNQGNLKEGISVEIHQEVARRLGMNLTLLELPWGRCEQYVSTQLADGILDNAPLPGCYHSDLATAFYPLAAYVRTDSPLQNFSWEMAKGLKVGMVRGMTTRPRSGTSLAGSPSRFTPTNSCY